MKMNVKEVQSFIIKKINKATFIPMLMTSLSENAQRNQDSYKEQNQNANHFYTFKSLQVMKWESLSNTLCNFVNFKQCHFICSSLDFILMSLDYLFPIIQDSELHLDFSNGNLFLFSKPSKIGLLLKINAILEIQF